MTISKFWKKFTSKQGPTAVAKGAARGRRMGKGKTVALESLPLSRPRSTAEISHAYKEGRFAEMSLRQVGL